MKTNNRSELLKSLTDKGVKPDAAEKIIALRDPDNSVTEISLRYNQIGAAGAKALA